MSYGVQANGTVNNPGSPNVRHIGNRQKLKRSGSQDESYSQFSSYSDESEV